MLAAAVEAARTAGRIQREHLRTAFEVRRKGAFDLVTEVDLACERAAREVLARLVPGTAVLGEEEGASGSGSGRWLLDPLDGTTNYAHGYPVFCVSIAWEEGGDVRLGAVYDPLREELFTAEQGRGARLDGRTIRTSGTAELGEALLATGFPYDRDAHPRNYSEFRELTQRTQGVRRSGSAALDLAYVACGRLDGFWEPGLKPWDLAAGALLVREAGGGVTGYRGEPFTPYRENVVASNGTLHPALLQVLSASPP
ncbi:MAG: inositol monophosphatase family protein [Deferrisomatales bacterium]|nr:inositol monophosphatase family protein [Deferrisomatales bacterium]